MFSFPCGSTGAAWRAAVLALVLLTYSTSWGQGQNVRVITINAGTPTEECPGQTILVSYTATGTYGAQNTFVARLFSPANVLVQSSNALPAATGSLNLLIPAGSPAGNYRIIVESTQNNVTSSNYAFRVRQVTGITAQPSNQTVAAFSPVTFTVGAIGENLTYRWRKDGVPIDGATGASYQISTATASSAGTYSVEVAGTCETVVSNNVTLTVTRRTPVIGALSAPAAIAYNEAIPVSGKISLTVNGIERYPTGQVEILAISGNTSVALGAASIAGDGTFAAELPANAGLGASATPYTLNFVYSGDPNFLAANNSSVPLVVNKAKAQLLVSDVVQTYNGAPITVTVTTEPAGLSTAVAYAPASAPVNAGTYTFRAELVSNPNYEADPVSGTLTVNKAIAVFIIDQSSLTQVYDGTPKTVSFTTVPAELSGVTVRYGGSLTPIVNAGFHLVNFYLDNPNYQATVPQMLLTIQKAMATLIVDEASLTQVYDGTPKTVSVSTVPAGLGVVTVRYGGSLTPRVNAGWHQVDIYLENNNYQAVPLKRTLTIQKAMATLIVDEASLTQVYDGTPKTVSVSTVPAGLGVVSVRYNGSLTPRVNVGSYQADIYLENNNFQATPLRRTFTITAPALAPATVAAAGRASFETRPEGTEPVSFGLKAYPNPFADRFSLSIGNGVAGDVAVTVVDGKGRSITRRVVNATEDGSRTVEIDLSSEAPGMYLLHVQAGARREMIKLIKLNR